MSGFRGATVYGHLSRRGSLHEKAAFLNSQSFAALRVRQVLCLCFESLISAQDAAAVTPYFALTGNSSNSFKLDENELVCGYESNVY